MIFISFLVYALAQSIKAAPRPSSSAIQFRDVPTCDCSNASNQRSLLDIIWSCLVTLFACIWLSVHPNVPSLTDSYFTIVRRRIRIMICALIVPEGVMYWAMRQWLGSRKLASRYKRSGWTTVHGHFLQMGGYVIDEPGRKPYTLSPELLESLLERKQIILPTICIEDIEDKSKGDFLAKGFVALQTLWFVTQCIARGAQRLTITELELVTLAFAVFNGITYFLWWHKPLDVRCPIHLQLLFRNSFIYEEPEEGTPVANSTIWQSFLDGFGNIFNVLFFNVVDDIREEGMMWALRKRLRSLVYPFLYFREILHQMTESDDSTNIPPNSARVPTFYAVRMDVTNEYLLDCTMSFFAMVFGSIHCIAWNFPFPSLTERTMWRISSSIIVCVPAVLLSFSLLRLLFIRPFFVVLVLNIIGLVAYIPSRIIIVFLAILSLRSLGEKAFEDVDWTSFFPHV
ncbi:hypothetical protein M413DRAFT_78294 [Hebeloma cylindrosporum]|uniref:Uncharacterized protein n=1 Tax=Hebeloma cylindrosporum TaxID=76867 RepID=A0A0C3BIE6_HEBCY|nr:hypothetical protein M413DRAFT_78294 [Hebeloma cylindrosporum h7]